MPSRSWRLRIEDMLASIDRIERNIQGMGFEDIAADDRTFDAVIRNLEVIGEAARHVPGEIEARYPDAQWHRIRGIRNVLIHEYFGASRDILWDTITLELPPLRKQLERVLSENMDMT